MWLGIAIAVGLIVWAVGGLLALNPLPWHIRKYWDIPGEKELRIIQAIALLLIVAGVTVFFVTEPGSFWYDLWPEMISTGGAVLGIDELNRRRSAQEYKRGIIRQMASFSNDFALEAARIAKYEGWLRDGSFVGADLRDANLAGANLEDANLAGANLARANLTRGGLLLVNFEGANLQGANVAGAMLGGANLAGANLWEANLAGTNTRGANFAGANLSYAHLEGVNLVYANLEGADLMRANLTGADLEIANLWGARLSLVNLEGAMYNIDTRWPKDFDPKSNGAINSYEMSNEEMIEWRKKYRPKQHQ